MGLKVWLPLLGNLNQQGCSNVTVSSNAITVNTAGKIGSCYQFNGTSSYIKLSPSVFSTATNEFSYACWFKPASTASGCLFSCRTATNNLGITLFINNSGNILYDIGGERRTKSYTLTANTWYHITFTYKKGDKKIIYINGTQIDSVNSTASMTQVASNNMFIGASQNADGTVNANYLNGYLNDVRIYDHCLSAAEVREISQGLVLHYSLNQHSLKPIGTNLVTGVTKGGQTSLLTDGRVGVITSGTSADTYFTVNLSESITNGTTYYLSCDVSGVSPGQYWGFPLGSQSNTSMPSKFYNGHNEYVFTANNINWGTNRLFLDDNYRNDYAHPASFYNFVLIKNPTFEEIDSSGYNHNGEIFGDLITVSDTKRYSHAIKWNCSDPTTNNATGKCYIKAPLTLYTPLQMSVSWWAKPENGYGGSVAHAAFCTSNGDSYSAPTDYNRTAFHHRDGAFDIYPSDASGVKRLTLAYTKNEWHHYVVTYDGTTAKVYKDGAEAASVTVGTNKTLSTFTLIYIGYSQAGGVQRKTLGTYSDFRVYCTALNTDAIRQLYEVGAKVDNKGNLHTFELNETNAKEITKAGVAKFNYIGELIDYNSKAEIGKIIHPNLLEGSNKIGSSTVHGWVSNGSATNMEILHDNILHYSYNLSNTKNIPSITTNTTVSCELGKIYTYTMELKFDKEIILGNSVPMHYWAGARNTNAITNTACNGNLSGITVGWILNHSGHLQPNTWVKIVTRFTFPSTISNSSYPYPAIRCFVYGGVLPEAYTGLVNVWMRNCKVEEGAESTPWVPHINDGCSSVTTPLPGWINTTELIEL